MGRHVASPHQPVPQTFVKRTFVASLYAIAACLIIYLDWMLFRAAFPTQK